MVVLGGWVFSYDGGIPEVYALGLVYATSELKALSQTPNPEP